MTSAKLLYRYPIFSAFFSSSVSRISTIRLAICLAVARKSMAFAPDTSEADGSTEGVMTLAELQAELQSLFGADGPLPKLSSLQQMGRKDIEEVGLRSHVNFPKPCF